MKRLYFLPALGFFLLAPVRAQDSVIAPNPLSQARERDCVQQISVSVLSHDGRIIQGLGAPNFQGSLGHKPVEILSVVWDQNPRRILILLDGRALRWTTETWELALNQAEELVDRMAPASEIGLVAFTSRNKITLEFTRDRQNLRQIITKFQPMAAAKLKGPLQNGLWDAVYETLKTFVPPRDGDVLYVISDGADTVSRIDWRELKTAAIATGVRIFAFRTQWMIGLDPAPVSGSPHKLQELVDATGGYSIVHFKGVPGMASAQLDLEIEEHPAEDRDRQFRQIYAYYRIGLHVPQGMDKPQKWDLRVIGPDEVKGNSVIYPQILASCSASSRSSEQAH